MESTRGQYDIIAEKIRDEMQEYIQSTYLHSSPDGL